MRLLRSRHFLMRRTSIPGMRGAFGKTYGKVARCNIGQVLISIRCREDKEQAAVEALRRAKFKFPGRQKIHVSHNWGFTKFIKADYEKLRTRWTIESNSVAQQNLIGYLIANLKPKLWEERASQIHIPSWKLHFESHLSS